MPNERSSDASNLLHQLHRAGQLERNAGCDLDRSWGRVDRRTAEACAGSVGQITTQEKPPEGGFERHHDIDRAGNLPPCADRRCGVLGLTMAVCSPNV